MKHTLTLASLVLFLAGTAFGADPAPRRLSREALRDKIKGAWAGQMIGVAYGAKTEFKARGTRFEGEIRPEPLSNAIGQDDLYVEMTFARVLDTVDLRTTSEPGLEAELSFEGTGIALVGPMSSQGGRADVFIDGRRHELTADAHVGPNLSDIDVWRAFELAPGRHVLRLVTRPDADPRSSGRAFGVRRAVVYSTETPAR